MQLSLLTLRLYIFSGIFPIHVINAFNSVHMTATMPTTDRRPLDDTPPRRIGLLVEPTPFTHVSGYSNRFNEMLKYLSKAGDAVTILTPDDSVDAPSTKFGFPIETIKGFRFSLYNEIYLSFDLRRIKALRIMREFKPDILHVSSPGFIVFLGGLLPHFFLNIPLVFSYHTHLPVYARNYSPAFPEASERLSWKVLKMVHNQADLTLVTSPQMKEELEANGIERVEVWRKGIDTNVFNPTFTSTEMRNRLSDGHPEDPLLLYVGRLGSEKCLTDLKDVLARIPNARLALVGKGPQMEELKEYFKGTKTVFTGLLRGEELSQAFASADVFCMPSDSETLGFVVLEAMASGVPVVGANAGGIPNLIDDGNTGYLFPARDTAKMAELVSRLLDDQAHLQNMSAACRAEAEAWDWESSTSDLRNNLYQKAIDNFKKSKEETSGSYYNFWSEKSKTLFQAIDQGYEMSSMPPPAFVETPNATDHSVMVASTAPGTFPANPAASPGEVATTVLANPEQPSEAVNLLADSGEATAVESGAEADAACSPLAQKTEPKEVRSESPFRFRKRLEKLRRHFKEKE